MNPLQEYQAVSIVKHPKFNPSRLDNNMAIITVDKVIDLTQPTVNTACLPSCDDQFDFRSVLTLTLYLRLRCTYAYAVLTLTLYLRVGYIVNHKGNR